MINNIVTASGGQQRDSAKHIHVSILPLTPVPCRLPHNIEQSFLCLYNRTLLVIRFKYSSVYMSIPNPLSFPQLFPQASKSVIPLGLLGFSRLPLQPVFRALLPHVPLRSGCPLRGVCSCRPVWGRTDAL